MVDEEKVIENLPMLLNLGEPDSIIGRASAFRHPDTNATRIEIHLSPMASDKLKDLQEVFDLKAIGFAGVARRPRARPR